MYRYIALLRGINVGGQKKIVMKDLKSLLTAAGFEAVDTYIQSGNIVLSSAEKLGVDDKIQQLILQEYGWEVSVLVMDGDRLEETLSQCPFVQEEKEKSYFVLFKDSPTKEKLRQLEHVDYPGEVFEVGPQCIYLYCATGYGRAKLSNNFFEKKLGLTATTRNYKTLMKLQTMISN